MPRPGEFQPLKNQLKEKFGYLSFECGFINLDVIGVKLLASNEVIAILYRGAWKCGWIYEGDKLSPDHVMQLYNDVPNSYNDLEVFEKQRESAIEILIPRKDNYVFINDKEVQKTKLK